MRIKFKQDFADMKKNDVVNFTQGASEVLNHDGISEQKSGKVTTSKVGCTLTTTPNSLTAILEDSPVEIVATPTVGTSADDREITIVAKTSRGFEVLYELKIDGPDYVISFNMPADDMSINIEVVAVEA